MVGTVIDIRAGFEAVDRGRASTEAIGYDLRYGCIAALIGIVIRLVAVLLCRPWRS